MEICCSPQLVATSLFFLTNAIVNYVKNYYIYSFLFLCLTITSVYYHSVNTEFSYIIDKIFVYLVVIYGGYIFLQNKKNIEVEIAVILLFSLTVYLYYYGSLCNTYCFDPDINISRNYHSLIHLFSSIGHHIIIAFA